MRSRFISGILRYISYNEFNPRQFATGATDLAKYESVLFNITRKPIYPTTNLPYEYNFEYTNEPKYSYIEDISTANPVLAYHNETSYVNLEGIGYDHGMKYGLYDNGTASGYDLYVLAVFPGSPAAKAGITRGCLIKKINGTSVGSNYNAKYNFLNSVLFGNSSMAIEGDRYQSGVLKGTFSANLSVVSYKSSPVLKQTVFTAGSKKIGYLAFAQFSNISTAKADLDAAFQNFSASSVQDLVIDLRYNGGGYVETATYLINLIAPSSISGQLMYTEHYNQMMQNKQATILKNQPAESTNGTKGTMYQIPFDVASNTEYFSKKGSLNGVANVVFIVSDETASAAELVINSLKPYLNVKLVGSKTFGKPVGFFPIRLEGKYDVYMPLFQTKNKNNEGDYFQGMTPDINTTIDDPDSDFGEPTEYLTKLALNVLAPNVTATAYVKGKLLTTSQAALPSNVKSQATGLKPFTGGNQFKGMIENRIHIK